MKSGTLDVGDGHTIYYEEHGTGLPVVVLHGGPGGGLQRSVLKLFDLTRWRVFLYDQRGCGRSTPALELRHNTTWDLVSDLEKLRMMWNVPKWWVFGGSWGTTLALAYASRHGDCVHGLILRGIYLGTRWENDWLYCEGGASRMRPTEWRRFTKGSRRRNLLDDYARRLHNRKTRRAAASAWWGWEQSLSTLKPQKDDTPNAKRMSIAVIENHYFRHGCWLKPNQLLRAARHMRFPIYIVQGLYDLVCPPAAAQMLADTAPNTKLTWTHAGHAGSEPETAAALKRICAQIVKA